MSMNILFSRKKMIRTIFIFLMYGLSVNFALAQANVSFSEIMYDPKGSDSGYEWVEIKNTSSSDISLKGWKFCEGKENAICHSFKDENNPNYNITKNSYAVITDSREKFLSKNNFSGLVLQSTGFSLLNSEGEKLQLKNSAGQLVDNIIYNPESGGKDGKTLCLIGDIWKNCQNTAGKVNQEASSSSDSQNDNNSGNSNSSSNSGSSGNSTFIPTTYVEFTDTVGGKKRIKASIDDFPIGIAGAKNSFFGRAYGLTDNEINSAEYFWAMGDGTKERGKKINHIYEFPGEYVISLTVKVGHFTGNAKRKIKIIAPQVFISNVDFEKKIIEISNKSNDLLSIEDWVIQVSGDNFYFPNDTFILPKGKILISNNILKFRNFSKTSRVKLLFPNLKVAYDYTDFLKEQEKIKKAEEQKKENKREENVQGKEVVQNLAKPNSAPSTLPVPSKHQTKKPKKSKKHTKSKKQKETNQKKIEKVEEKNNIEIDNQQTNQNTENENVETISKQQANISINSLSDNNLNSDFLENNKYMLLLLFFNLIVIVLIFLNKKGVVEKKEIKTDVLDDEEIKLKAQEYKIKEFE